MNIIIFSTAFDIVCLQGLTLWLLVHCQGFPSALQCNIFTVGLLKSSSGLVEMLMWWIAWPEQVLMSIKLVGFVLHSWNVWKPWLISWWLAGLIMLVIVAGLIRSASLLLVVSLCRPVTEMVQDIRQGNWLRFGTGKLRELCKLLPEDTEVTTAPLVLSYLYTLVLRIK